MNLSKVDVVDFLEALDIRNVDDDGEEVRFSCPFPGHNYGDNNPSAYMNKATTAFFCHGCHAKGNAIYFLAKLEGISPLLALRYIRERYDTGFVESTNLLTELEDLWTDENEPDMPNPVIVYKMDPLVGNPKEYMLARGFCEESLEWWGLGFDPISDRITIPIYNHNGWLVGFKGRAYKEEHQPKYLILGDRKYERYGFRTYEVGKEVFGLDTAKAQNDIIICEGELNVIALWQKGFKNAVAISGSNFTNHQRDLILAYADSVTLFLDDDPAGQKATAKIAEELEPLITVKIVGPHDGDPADLSAADCARLLSEAKSTTELWLD